jgi:FtsH-binding integral membrane protein
MVLEKAVGLHSTHIDKHMYLTNLFAIPAILIYVLALREKKNKDYNGVMSFKQGFVSGLIITIIVGIFSPLTQWIISTIITPEYFPNVIAYSVETGYHNSLEEAQAYFNLENYMKQSAIGALIMGIITSAVVAFFVKSKAVN